MSPARLPGLVGIAVVVLLLVPTSAGADFQTLYDDYRADGVIDGCSYSPAALSSGLNDIPADVREYDPAFSDAINAALEQAATGCGAGPQKAAASIKNEISASDGSPGPAPPQGLALAAAGDGRGVPAILLAVMIALGAALGAAGALGAARRYGRGAGRRSRSKSPGA